MIPRLAKSGRPHGRYKKEPKRLTELQKKAIRLLVIAGMPDSEIMAVAGFTKQQLQEAQDAKQDT